MDGLRAKGQDMRHEVDDAGVVRLKAYRFNLRKPKLECQRSELVLVLPAYFGRNAWRVPIGEVAVADLTWPGLVVEASQDWYPDGIVIPYLFTTGRATRPTTLLLFGEPQWVPPLRLLAPLDPDRPIGYRASRSAAGARVDGVLLRAMEPAKAAARLVAAGPERVENPKAWLRAHRRVATGTAEQAALRDRASRTLRLRRARTAALVLATGTLYWLQAYTEASWWSWWLLAVPAAALVAAIAFHAMARRAPRG